MGRKQQERKAGPRGRARPRPNVCRSSPLHERHGVQTNASPTGVGKMPDLQCVGQAGSLCPCEVKACRSDPDWRPADGKMHLNRDNGPERVERALNEAQAQSSARSARPWALVLVNRNSSCVSACDPATTLQGSPRPMKARLWNCADALFIGLQA